MDPNTIGMAIGAALIICAIALWAMGAWFMFSALVAFSDGDYPRATSAALIAAICLLMLQRG